jgi:hypothetical protein
MVEAVGTSEMLVKFARVHSTATQKTALLKHQVPIQGNYNAKYRHRLPFYFSIY